MAVVDRGDVRTGFWVAVGVIAAFVLYGLVVALAARLRGADRG